MVTKLVRGWALWLVVALASTAPAAAQGTLYNRGLRWIGIAPTCTAPPGWLAEHLFRGSGLPSALTEFCLYSWTGATAPSQGEIVALFAGSGADQLTEDVPVLYPGAAEEQYYTGLRSALRAHVGTAALLPSMPARPRVRIAVVDSAPDAPAGAIHPGTNRHGDTLAHMIEDLVCAAKQDADVRCAAEVTTVLALPWVERGVAGAAGGNLGSLADLARAIERAVLTWEFDRLTAPGATPERLILNLSLGWEHTPQIADCAIEPRAPIGPPALAVKRILQRTAARGVLIIAAAGNDAGGPEPRTGLVCPGRFQALPQTGAPSQPLLTAVSGLDYRDHALETARPHGITGISALGLGGVGWRIGEPLPLPPQLTGSSVATAVVSAVSALVWAAQPGFSPGRVTQAVYDGGVVTASAGNAGYADACPLLLGSCRVRRASVCGALLEAGVPAHCVSAQPRPWSSPSLPAETAALAATLGCGPTPANLVSVATIPRFQAPAVQVQPWVFPAPVSVGCRACMAGNLFPASQPYLAIPEHDQPVTSPVLVVQLMTGNVYALELGPALLPATPYLFPLPPGWVLDAAYLTGFDPFGGSIAEQIFVQQ